MVSLALFAQNLCYRCPPHFERLYGIRDSSFLYDAHRGCVSAAGDDVFGDQVLGSSDWPDFEGDPAFTVPPKAMPELYTVQGDPVRCPKGRFRRCRGFWCEGASVVLNLAFCLCGLF